MSDSEQFYDDEIAPALFDLARKCEAKGISFVTVAEWAPGETGRTATLQTNAGVGIRIVELAARCHGNVDALFMALVKYGKEHGHSSIFLSRLSQDA